VGLASLAIIRGYVVRRFAKWISGSWRMLPRAGGRCWLALAAGVGWRWRVLVTPLLSMNAYEPV
jgi:hypothetical protein